MRKPSSTNPTKSRSKWRRFDGDVRREAEQMMLDDLSASLVAERMGLSGTNLL